MRVCLLSKMFPPGVGGSEQYAYELATALAERGHEVDVFTQAVDSDRTVPIHRNVTVERITRARRWLVTFETLYYSLKARSVVDFEAYDVVHGTLMPASTIGLGTARSIDTPIVVTSHGTSVGETLAHSAEIPTDYLKRYFFHPTNVVFDAVAGWAADHVIAISQQTREQLERFYPIDPARISLVPHGVDTDRFRPREESHPAVSSDRPSVLFVGRLVSRKHVDDAIRAFARLDDTDAELLVAGTGRHAERLERLSVAEGIEDRVSFLGFVPDEELPRLYSAADLFVSPSKYEGFGLVVLEAMASGTPVVGTPTGVVPDLVKDGETGFVVDHGPEAIAMGLDRALASPEDLDRMSTITRQVAEQWDWDRVGASVEAVYERLCDAE